MTEAFFPPLGKTKTYYALGHLWYSVATSVTFSRNLYNSEKHPSPNFFLLKTYKKNYTKSNKYKKEYKRSIKLQEIQKNLKKFRKTKNLHKFHKIIKNLFLSLKNPIIPSFFPKKNPLFSKFCHLRRLVFDQSSPVHPVFESRGGSVRVTQE